MTPIQAHLSKIRHAWRCAVALVLLLLAATGALAVQPAGGSSLRVMASATYVPPGYTQTETIYSNQLSISVLSVEAISLTQSQSVSLPPGSPVTLSHQLRNTGNVTSAYSLSWSNGGTNCPAGAALQMGGMRLVQDVNSNGVADGGEPVVALNTPRALTLNPGDSTTLLAIGTMPVASNGSACATLTVTSAAQSVSASNTDQITIGNVAVLSLQNAAAFSAPVQPGTSRVDFTITGNNVGNQSATPTATEPAGTSILVNGVATNLVLIRNAIPTGSQYIAGSLQTTIPGAIKLFRLPADAPFSYRTNGDDASAIEVAVGVPMGSAITVNTSFRVQLSVTVTAADSQTQISGVAQAYYNNGLQPASSDSNIVPVPVRPARIGVSEWAGVPLANANGSADVQINVRVKNYGSTWLYGAQLTNLLAGTGGTQFGTYTAAAAPGSGQYTVVAGSLKVVAPTGGIGGQVIQVNNAFNGTPSNAGLLESGAVLPPNGDATLQFIVRFGTGGLTQTLQNSTSAAAAVVVGGSPFVTDDSVNGPDPDPDGDGNPNNNASPTPIAVALPLLTLNKQLAPPRYVSSGVYDVDVLFKVSNTGTAGASNLRVIDNLDCAFSMDKPDGAVARWELRSTVRSGSGILTPSARFTGRATCDRSIWDSTDPRQFPPEISLSLTDGSKALAPGQSEQLGFTVRVYLKSAFVGTRVAYTNKGWTAALAENAINLNGVALTGASSTSAQGLLIDPQGTVYDAVSRNPITGAIVTVQRQSCEGGSAGPITVDQVLGGGMGIYTYNADGSMSMTTGADGMWQFYWNSPPVNNRCVYSFKVTPPAGSGYIFPAQRIPPQAGTFNRCAWVTPNATPPAEGQDTTYYTSISSGLNADGSPCEVLHNHIPLDPGLPNGLLLRKDASKQQVEFGDFLDYALTVTNKTGFPVTGINFTDTLPAGFAYVPNSSRFNGAVVSNPGGGVGPALSWQVPDFVLKPDQMVMMRYRVRVGVGARIAGKATNTAQASSKGYQSNLAQHTVRVNGGVFSDEAFVFGKVYMDCKRDRQQEGEDEPGVPGVRLWLEDGTNVVTDGEGRWSLYGLKPVTHVLRLDEITLPAGAKVEIQDNRNAGNAASRFVDLKKGEFQKANFPLSGCEDGTVKQEVERRRKDAAKALEGELAAALRSRLDPQAQTVAVGDTRGMPAAGQVNGSGAGASLSTVSGPLIALPGAPRRGAESVGGGSFLDGSGGIGGSGTLATAQQSRLPAATGQVPATGNGQQSPGQTGSVTQSLVPVPVTPSPIELEKVLPGLDKTPGFIELRDGDTVGAPVVNVRVKGPAGTTLQLTVNDEVQDGRRVGKKAVLPSTGAEAWEYIGVALKPGANRLQLQIVDSLGIARETPVTIRIVAPDKLGMVRLDLPADARADGRTPVPVIVQLTDAAGVPVLARTQVTLESDAGRWVEEDLNPNVPGLQAFIEGGKATFHLMPPGVPGDLRLRVTANGIVQEARVALLPELRPMIAVGVVEGTLDLTKRGKLGIDQLPAGAAFEQELTSLSSNGDTGNSRVGGRAAFFLKGAIKGDYLLTASLDTNKSSKDRLFRDIRPDEFYPVYGDSSERGYDAQSSQKLYVRIDKNRSYLLYGDFATTSSTEVRKLSQTSRTLTGMKGVYDDNGMRITAYGSRTSQTQQIEEFAGRGISGPYYLAGSLGDMVQNSETVEILSRDRNQPNVILKTTTLARFVDYTLEPSTRRLMFVSPVSSADKDLNPQSVRVTYEVDTGGPKYTVAGVDAQFKVGERVQAGVVAHVDEDPKNPRRMTAVTGLARLGEHTSMAAEAVRTHSDDKGDGSASRVELRHQTENLGVSVQAARSSTGFDNPAAGFSAGHTDVSARAEYRVSPTLAARAEALYTSDQPLAGAVGQNGSEPARGQSVSLLKRFNSYLSGEVGLRHGATANSGTASMFSYDQVSSYGSVGGSAMGNSVTSLGSQANASSSLASSQNDLTTVRGRLTATLPGAPQAQVFVEGEQATDDSRKHMAAIGGNYAITDKTRVYGRYELSSTLYDDTTSSSGSGNTIARNVGILGIESAYMEGGRVYNEYRLANADDSRTAQIANGVRNTIKLGEHWSVTGGIERARALGTVSSNSLSAGLGSSTAITSGVEYTNGAFRASGVLESRHASDANTLLNNVGVGYRLNEEWSLLARSIYNSSVGQGSQAGNERTQSRQQLGAAYRPVNDDRWNALARYEHRSEVIRGDTATAGTISGNSFGSDASLPGNYDANIVSLHVNYNPTPGNVITGRLAAKQSTYDDGLLKSSYTAQLLYARWTRDLNAKWDLSVQGGLLHGSGGALQKSLGLEVGYQVMNDLWFSVGYNAIGLSDRDLTAGEYTSKGAYFRLRFKFDETGLGFERSGSGKTSGTASGTASGSGSPPVNPVEAPPRLVMPAAGAAEAPSAPPPAAAVPNAEAPSTGAAQPPGPTPAPSASTGQ